MPRALVFIAALIPRLMYHTTAQSTSVVNYLIVGDGPTYSSLIDNMPVISDSTAASIINAAPTGTTYFAMPVINDPKTDADASQASYLTSVLGMTITVAPSAYDMTIGAGSRGQGSLHCEMSGTTPLICTGIGPGNQGSDGGKTMTSLITPGTNNYYYDVMTVTAGLEKLAGVSATATSDTSTATATPSATTVSANSPVESTSGAIGPAGTSAPITSTAMTPTLVVAPSSSVPSVATSAYTGAASRLIMPEIGGWVAGIAGVVLYGVRGGQL